MDAPQNIPSDSAASQPDNTAAKLTPAQIEKIADENGEVYRRDVFKTAFKTHSQSLWAGGLFGIVAGGGVGALTAISTLIVGVPLAAVGTMLLPVIGTFAIAGMALGITKFTLVGASTGAIIGGEKIADRKKLLKNPTEEIQDHVIYQGTTGKKHTAWSRIIPFTKGSEKLFNWKAAIAFGVAGLALGGLMVATGGAAAVVAALPAVASALGVSATTLGVTHALGISAAALIPAKVVTCMTLTACTSFGLIYSTDIPTIAANMTDFVAGIFSGKSFERSKERSPELAKAAAIATAIPRSAQVKEPVVFKTTSSTLVSPIGSYAGQVPGKHLRKLAEQQFKNMQPNQGSSIN